MIFRSSTSKENVLETFRSHFSFDRRRYGTASASARMKLRLSHVRARSRLFHIGVWRVHSSTRACSFCYSENIFNCFPHLCMGPGWNARQNLRSGYGWRLNLYCPLALTSNESIEWQIAGVHTVSDWRLAFEHIEATKTELFPISMRFKEIITIIENLLSSISECCRILSAVVATRSHIHMHGRWLARYTNIRRERQGQSGKRRKKRRKNRSALKRQKFNRFLVGVILKYVYYYYYLKIANFTRPLFLSAFSLIRFASYQLLAKIENLTENEKARRKRSARTI